MAEPRHALEETARVTLAEHVATESTVPGADELAEMMASEQQAGRVAPYRRIAAMLHVIAAPSLHYGRPSLGPARKPHRQFRVAQVRAAQVRATQVRITQVRTVQVRGDQGRAAKVRIEQVYAAEVRVAQVRAAQVRTMQIRVAQEHTDQAGARQLEVAEVELAFGAVGAATEGSESGLHVG